MDTVRLGGTGEMKVACAYRLLDVIDARPAGDHAGGLGGNMFMFDDVAAVVRQQLTQIGLNESDEAARAVSVRILRFYLTQSNATKIPVVVYEVRIDQQPPFLIRSQQASMNWNGTEKEAYAAYSGAMFNANRQLAERLNGNCAGNR